MTYDNNGNLQTMTDSNGTTIYTWNARNQLVGISGPNVNASFVYDGLGRREKKTINSNVTEFLYDGLNPVQETSGATILANILPGLGIDEFLTRTDVVAGVTSSFLMDALGSPVAVTDNTGTVQTEYTYEPFGKTTVTGLSNSNSYQYTGRENDGMNLYFYRNRYYQPQLQRFIGEDPVNLTSVRLLQQDSSAFDSLADNLLRQPLVQHQFSYVINNPLVYTDPTGECGPYCRVFGAITALGGIILEWYHWAHETMHGKRQDPPPHTEQEPAQPPNPKNQPPNPGDKPPDPKDPPPGGIKPPKDPRRPYSPGRGGGRR